MDEAITPPSPTPALSGLPDLTRRLQDERDLLRAEVEELTRRLAQECAARSTLTNEAQLREVELRDVQQRSSQATQEARDKQLALEKELEDEIAMHKMAVLGRNAATQKNTALTMELKNMETKWRIEMEKKESAVAEAELATAEIQKLKADRDQLVQRTESDAKRVRELWQQIEREHEVKVEALKQELQSARQQTTAAEAAVAECHDKIKTFEEMLQTTQEEKTALQERLTAASNDKSRSLKQQNLDRLQIKSWKNEKHLTALKVQQASSECKLHAEREEAARKERDTAILAARNFQKEVGERNEELLALKAELADLLDKHELLATQYKQSARERETRLIMRTRKLRDSKRYAKELAQIRHEEVLRYKQVIYAINARLTEVHELSKSTHNNTWSLPPDVKKSKPSLCIFRH